MKTQLTTTPRKEFALLKPSTFSDMWQDFDDLFESIERRAYQLFDWRGRENGHDLEDWFRAEREFLQPLNMEVTEKENNLIIRADVPGFEAKDLEVTLDPENITIRGVKEAELEKKEKEKEKKLYSERSSEHIYRTMMLPASVLAEKAVAVVKDGVLEVTAPKAVQAKRIEVKAA
jgi:HSP20 family protein